MKWNSTPVLLLQTYIFKKRNEKQYVIIYSVQISLCLFFSHILHFGQQHLKTYKTRTTWNDIHNLFYLGNISNRVINEQSWSRRVPMDEVKWWDLALSIGTQLDHEAWCLRKGAEKLEWSRYPKKKGQSKLKRELIFFFCNFYFILFFIFFGGGVTYMYKTYLN